DDYAEAVLRGGIRQDRRGGRLGAADLRTAATKLRNGAPAREKVCSCSLLLGPAVRAVTDHPCPLIPILVVVVAVRLESTASDTEAAVSSRIASRYVTSHLAGKTAVQMGTRFTSHSQKWPPWAWRRAMVESW